MTFEQIRAIQDNIRSGEPLPQAEVFELHCGHCGILLGLYCKSWGLEGKRYCNQACYMASLYNPGYKPWRQGQRLARAIVSQYFVLPEGAIVHHKDGDNRNNDRANLAVYAGNGDHVRAHRTRKSVLPLWDGVWA